MRKPYLITAILLLSSIWVGAQNRTPPNTPDSQQYPSSSAPSQQQPTVPAPPDTSRTATAPLPSDQAAKTVAGCLGGASGSYTLTDSAGKTWQLTGDTAKLGDHVNHMVEVSGAEEGQGAFTVKKLKMIPGVCPGK